MTDLIQVLEERSCITDKGITFIEGSESEAFLCYQHLFDSARRALAGLSQKGIGPGDELVFQIEENRSFVIVFWACILGGIIPVPLTIGRTDDHKLKLFNVWRVLRNPWLIASGEQDKMRDFAAVQGLDPLYQQMESRSVDLAEILSCTVMGEVRRVRPDDIAFIQFSSGSTGQPKGVVLTHKNLLTNIRAISAAAGYSPEDRLSSWMPLTHDMGLIGFHLNPLYCGIQHYLMPPAAFVRRPALWLDIASQHKVSILCSPNFGYQYLIKHCFPATDRYDWDLSPVRIVYNGAEPVSEQLCVDFLRHLAPYGLKSHAMCPVYGLAEASLAVSISGLQDEVIAIRVDRNKAGLGDTIVPCLPGKDALSFVNVGTPVNDCAIRIADQEDRLLGENSIGHLQMKGENVTSGYYNNAGATKNAFTADGWFRTGDLAFLRDGVLYITGRAKDIIFSNGQNYYPHDLERIAQEVLGIELNKIAVAGYFNHKVQRDEIAAFVLHRDGMETFLPIAQALQAAINGKTGLHVDRIIPVKDIPRTTSGKLQRFRLVEQLNNGAFESIEQFLQQQATGTAALPENETEEQLLDIWRRVLDNVRITVEQHFFETGGNSLKAAEVAMLIRKTFGVDVPPDTLYIKPTVKALAGEICSLRDTALQDGDQHEAVYLPLPEVPESADYPLSSAQKRIYYACELDRSSVAYNLPAAFRITGELNRSRLHDCIQRLMDRNHVWRMAFNTGSNEPRWRVLHRVPFELTEHRCAPGEVDALLRSLVRPFDLGTGPLFRIELLQTGKTEYLLFADFHHLIADGISVYHFIRELLDLYRGKELAPPPAEYAAYVHWQGLRPEAIKMQETYWLDYMNADGLPVLEMPTDFLRPTVFDTRGGKIFLAAGEAVTRRLRKVAADNDCPLHTLLFTAYAVLLARYTGEEEMIIGIPVGGRNHPDLQTLQGMFANNLPIRCRVRGDATFSELLEEQRTTLSDALHNQEYPFDELVRSLSLKRDVSRNPLFDTMFVYQNMGVPSAEGAGFTLSWYPFDPGFAKFDISMEVFDDGKQLQCGVEYSQGLFERATIGTFVRHFELLIQRILQTPNGRIADLSALSAREYEDRIVKFNATGVCYMQPETIQGWFEQQVERTPGNIAIESGPVGITYSELDKKAGQLARLFRSKGIGPDKVVAICLPNSPGLIVAIMAVLKARGCYLPIDTALPEERIRYLLQDSGCNLFITGRPMAGKIGQDNAADRTVIDIDEWEPADGPLSVSSEDGAGHDLAYIIYTSGTTGMPKGVMIEHGSLTNYIAWAVDQYGDQGRLDMPLFTSISFDLTVTSLFAPLVTGGKVVIYNDATPDLALARIFADNAVNCIKLTPSHLRLLEAMVLPASTEGCRIKRFVVGGERLEARLAAGILDRVGEDTWIFNEYGPTEATVGCMIHTYSRKDATTDVPIGVPAANMRVYVLDKYLQPVPAGVIGEIYIAGRGLARGYLNNDELTGRKFIPDPFRPTEKMYKTGDRGRYLAGGILEYAGRYDEQLKLNGHRIEPGEIASQLKLLPGIADVVVAMRGNGLCAYYTEREGSSGQEITGESSWRMALARQLPHYMIPSHFMRLDSLPLTRNGKIDLAALPEPVRDRGKDDRRLPADEIERLSLVVWQEVLGEEDLCVTDNFFELGGDSIKAVQIVSRLKERGIFIQARDVLTYQTIARVSSTAVFTGREYAQGVVQGRTSLSPIASWFFSLGLATPEQYNQSVLLKLNKPVDRLLLRQAFIHLLEHHDGLRLNFDAKSRTLFYNEDHRPADLLLEDDVLSPLVFRELKSGFDLEKSLLFRVALLTEPDAASTAGWLFVTAHHLIMDAVSWRILLEDLYTVYNALVKGQAVRLPLKTASLIEWETAWKEYIVSAGCRDRQPYWDSIDKIPFTLPQDLETDDWRALHAQQVKGSLDKAATSFLLKEAQQVYNTDVPVILNAALAYTLHEWTGLERFVVEQEHYGRGLNNIDVSRTLGWFTVLYPLLLEWKGDTPGDQLQRIKEEMRNIPDRGISYGMRPCREGQPTTPIRFNYLGQFGDELDNDLFAYSDLTTGSETGPENRLTARLEWNVLAIHGELRLEINYNRDAHRESTMQWLCETFLRHLGNILDHIKTEKEIRFTPADFEAALNEEDLKELFK